MTGAIGIYGLIAVLAAATPEEELRGAIEDFEFGDHAVAAKRLTPLLDPIRLTSAEDVIVARQYLGACHYLLNQRAKAEAEFSKILVIDREHKLDPAVFSPALVQFFDEVRARTGLSLKREPDPAPKLEPAPPPPVQPPPPAREEPPLALAFVPFGVGQFNNGHPGRGAAFAAVEVALLGTAAVTFTMFQSTVDQHAVDRGGQLIFDDQANADRAATLQSLFLASFWSAIGVMAIGVTEALISHPGDAISTGVQAAVHVDAEGARAQLSLAF